MKFIEIKKYLEKMKVFSTNDLLKIDDKFNKKKLSWWVKKWYLKNIRRWYYILQDIEINDNILYLISNKSYFPSYISFETALSYYWIIPETVYSITWITSKKTFEFEFENINFSYKSIKSELFFWYTSVNFWENSFFLWELEKVLLDYLYFKKDIKDLEDIRWLRLNRDILQKIDLEKINKYVKIFNKKFLFKKLDILVSYIKKW